MLKHNPWKGNEFGKSAGKFGYEKKHRLHINIQSQRQSLEHSIKVLDTNMKELRLPKRLFN